MIRFLMAASFALVSLISTTGCWANVPEPEPFEALCLTGSRLGGDTFAVHTEGGGFITVRRDDQQFFYIDEDQDETQFVSSSKLEEAAGVELVKRDGCVEDKQPSPSPSEA